MSNTHHEESFWTKYIFSQDHKVIALQYVCVALAIGLTGMFLSLLMRLQTSLISGPIGVVAETIRGTTLETIPATTPEETTLETILATTPGAITQETIPATTLGVTTLATERGM